MDLYGQSLEQVVRRSEHLLTVRREDLWVGDVMYVKTCNSMYCIQVEEHRTYRVTGGWFDRRGDLPVMTTTAGCTWGGSIINVDFVATVGLSIEFGNRVVTGAIKSFVLLQREKKN